MNAVLRHPDAPLELRILFSRCWDCCQLPVLSHWSSPDVPMAITFLWLSYYYIIIIILTIITLFYYLKIVYIHVSSLFTWWSIEEWASWDGLLVPAPQEAFKATPSNPINFPSPALATQSLTNQGSSFRIMSGWRDEQNYQRMRQWNQLG